MHSFHYYSPFHFRGDDVDRNGAADFEEVLQSVETGIRRSDSAHISTICSMYNGMKGSNPKNLETASSGLTVEKCQFMLHKGGIMLSDADDGGVGAEGNSGVVADQNKEKDEELLKLAHNSEAARKSGMRKQAYIQQLENSHQRLTELDHIFGRAQQQVASGYLGHSIGGRGGGAFGAEHTWWRGEHQRLIDDLRSSLSYNRNDKELNLVVGAVISHYGELLQIKKAGARSDMFHILSGVWRTPAERCLMWLKGFRPSDLLKVVEKQIQP